jgi:hypothetical protein
MHTPEIPAVVWALVTVPEMEPVPDAPEVGAITVVAIKKTATEAMATVREPNFTETFPLANPSRTVAHFNCTDASTGTSYLTDSVCVQAHLWQFSLG